MLLFYHSWMFYNHFIVILYHFLVLTNCHSAQCQLLFSACFLHRRKSIPNGVQMQRNFLWIFLGQKTSSGPRKHLGVPRGEQHPSGRARRPRHALVGAAPLEHPLRCFLGPLTFFWPKKSSRSFVAFGLYLILISYNVKNMQKTTTSTGHYVNRLVPKNDYKMIVKHPRMII